MERLVGELHQLGEIGRELGRFGAHPQADREVPLGGFTSEVEWVHRETDPFRHHQGRGLVGLRQQHQELLAAEPESLVLLPHRFPQGLGYLLENPVAGVVAEAVVDLLEMVEIQLDQGVAGWQLRSIEGSAVGQARERIAERRRVEGGHRVGMALILQQMVQPRAHRRVDVAVLRGDREQGVAEGVLRNHGPRKVEVRGQLEFQPPTPQQGQASIVLLHQVGGETMAVMTDQGIGAPLRHHLNLRVCQDFAQPGQGGADVGVGVVTDEPADRTEIGAGSQLGQGAFAREWRARIDQHPPPNRWRGTRWGTGHDPYPAAHLPTTHRV